MSTWDLEEWYEDLQEVLSLDVTSKIIPPEVGQEQEEFDEIDETALLWSLETPTPLEPNGIEAAGTCELDSTLTAELLKLLGEEPTGPPESGPPESDPPESDSSHSSPPQTGTDDEETVSNSRKRKRTGQPQRGKRQRGREREQENERRVAELMAHNEQLQKEIERLSAEVETTRAALIQRMVSLKT